MPVMMPTVQCIEQQSWYMQDLQVLHGMRQATSMMSSDQPTAAHFPTVDCRVWKIVGLPCEISTGSHPVERTKGRRREKERKRWRKREKRRERERETAWIKTPGRRRGWKMRSQEQVVLASVRRRSIFKAIKMITKEEDNKEELQRERRLLLAARDCPFLCHLSATLQSEDHVYFVMEYLSGGSLQTLINVSGKLNRPTTQ
ncbi:hypothetical protein GDO78_003605 [Eleutherodactylus coqui]|uniref:non-specific serine/threonine protein kinase n=1 Tax=Eleutherodactylus coqui TaxID=57060 RepID=A0A8J6EUB6_ELECQ|nr:hypothetical protein GDO78_003605 [Eleutherodactylus coqui]